MNDLFSTYEERLKSHMNFNVIVLLAIFTVFLVLIVCLLFWVKDKKLALITFLTSIAISLFIYFSSILPYQIDINKKDYIVYTGEFYIEEYFTSNRTDAYIFIVMPNDEKSIRYTVACDIDEIESDTSYYGYFVYAKKTKALVDIKIDYEGQDPTIY